MEYYFFYKNCFSQWHESNFTIDGVVYCRAEQWMMAEKARLFNDPVTEKLIMEATHPRDHQRFGREVRNFDQAIWDASARDIVFQGNYAKFEQNADLREKLLATGDKLLVEASPTDRIWGIGLGMDDERRHDPKNWQGTNWLGEVLTKVRDCWVASLKTS